MAHLKEFKVRTCVGTLILVRPIFISVVRGTLVHQVNAFVSDYVILTPIVLIDVSQVVTIVTLHILTIVLITLKGHALIKDNFIFIFVVRSIVTLILKEVLLLIIRKIVQINIVVSIIVVIFIVLIHLQAVVLDLFSSY